MDRFRDRTAVITGGAGGIGMAMARAFAARKARIVLADLDAEALRAAVEELRRDGATAHGVHTDVTARESVQELAEQARRLCGGVHLVCNNAGVGVFGQLSELTHRDWEYSINVNVWGVVHGVEVFLPLLFAQGAGGHIVNTASMAGLVGMQWLGAYCATKFAVVGLSEALYRELKPRGIGVSVLCPMIVDTKINENSARMRPAELRNDTPGPQLPSAASLVGGVVAAADVASRVVRAVDRGDLYILTHPEQREILRRRAAHLDAACADLADSEEKR